MSLLAARPVLDDRDPDQLVRNFRNNWREIRDVKPRTTSNFFTRTGRIRTEGLAVIEMETSGFSMEIADSRFVMLSLPKASGLEMKCGRRTWQAAPGLGQFSDGRAFAASYEPGYRGYSVLVEKQTFHRAAEIHAGEPLPTPAGHSGVFDAFQLRAIRAEIDALEQELRCGGLVSESPVLGPEIETRFMMALLSGPLARGSQRAALSQASRASLQRAVDFIRANYAEPFRAHDLARAAGANLRALQASFRHAYGASPWQYLQMCRLAAARRTLSARGSSASVTEAAIDAGFTHLGEFSRLYRQRFGESPRDTRKASHDARGRLTIPIEAHERPT